MTTTSHILLIDEDEVLLEMIEATIYLHNPAYRVLRATSLDEALEVLDSTRIDLVIIDIEFSVPVQVAPFLVGLQKRTPPPLVLVLTASPLAGQPVRLRVNSWLPKPPQADLLLRRIDQLIASTRESVLRGISLDSFLQMIAHDRKTCTLTITSGDRLGHLYLQNGELIHADTPTQQAKSAALTILSWPDCTIRVSNDCQAKRTLDGLLTNLLLDAGLYRDGITGDHSRDF